LATSHGTGGGQEGIGLSDLGDFWMDFMGIPGRIIWEYKIRVLYGEVSWGYLDSGDRIAIKNLVNMQSKNCNFHRENELLNMLNSSIFDDIQFSDNPIYLQSSIFEK
jgi:hypothetical protein